MKPASCRTIALRLSRLRTGLPSLASNNNNQSFHHQRCLASTLAKDGRIASARTKAGSSFSTAVMEADSDDDDEQEQEYHSNTTITPPAETRNVWGHKASRNSVAARTQSATRRNNYQQPPNPNSNQTNGQASSAPQLTECTCGFQKQQDLHEDAHEPLPPPLPKPVYSVHKRVLPPNLTALSSPEGRQYLLESMSNNTAESYWALTEQFVNQSDPAYCGVTTLLMVLNAMNIDPNVRWKGGWRFYGDEDVLLQRCCLNADRIRRVGITMEQFMILGTCHGMEITMKRPTTTASSTSNATSQPRYTLEDFRNDIRQTLDSRLNRNNSILVTSFSRAALQQTGDGHYSPIAAYHEASDQVLVLDVARFKYAPYWAFVEDLYQAMEPLDKATQLPRGWYIMRPPSVASYQHETKTEDRRPAHLVPEVYEKESCPVGKIKVEFCPAKDPTNQ